MVFGAPLVLIGLAALPVIWWLLRLTPPRPVREIFPPLKILARVLKTEETPHKSPWWLTALRLMLAAFVILALAEPVLNPAAKPFASGRALALIIDNGWVAAPDWPARALAAQRLAADAGDAPVIIVFTAGPADEQNGPFDPAEAARRIAAARPAAVPVDRPSAFARAAIALKPFPGAALAFLSDGLATEDDKAAFDVLAKLDLSGILWFSPANLKLAALNGAESTADGLKLFAVRPSADSAAARYPVGAFDEKGRRIADAELVFAAGSQTGEAMVTAPFEIRNDISHTDIDGQKQAGAVRLMDENQKRRRIGLLAAAEADQDQPLLSPIYYIRRALEPFADLADPQTADLALAIPQLLERKPAMIVLADVGVMPAEARRKLLEFVEGGGTLVRFAGSRLAASGLDEDLLPVKLRTGERALDGALSWTVPQQVAEFAPGSPFAGLAAPRDVTVSRQVLADPSPDLAGRTWASLTDGTPLVTGATRGKGRIVLFHVPTQATWSTLPISGTFVDMLRRITQMARNQGAGAQTSEAAALPPFRMISADGVLTAPPPEAKPLEPGTSRAALGNPPGFYGTEEGVAALNLLEPDDRLLPLVRPETAVGQTTATYAADASLALKGPLLLAALILLVLDALAVMALSGDFRRKPAMAAAALVVMLFAGQFTFPGNALANDAKPGDADSIAAISTTRLAYVLTGDPAIDAVSREGLAGLTRFLIEKTALEPGEPKGVDIASDEMAFYPLLYWPVSPDAPMPSEAAIARIDAYMQQGGTVLFDTRDQLENGFSGDATPSTGRLRDILSGLNVPPLEPVPADHVLAKSFYLLAEFPGRYAGSPLWVEALEPQQEGETRPVRGGDGVSGILITANDLASAWAVDETGNPLYPTVPNDPGQRDHAFRTGVNIAMYVLTGNYKSDQVHIPALLERLGQ